MTAQIVGRVPLANLGILLPFPPLHVMVRQALGDRAGLEFALWAERTRGYPMLMRWSRLLRALAPT